MKNYINLVLVALLFTLSQVARADGIAGLWSLVSGEYVDTEGELINYNRIGMKSIKVITDKHFSFTSMKGDAFWASATGTYEFTQGTYAETVGYNSFNVSPGSVFSFTSRIEGDFWYNARWEGEKRVEYEVWKRLE
ncbi:hypothetical protein [Lacimicrobium sp. SS2-24]|uniref:hypothetical protein n=1 Tax=Lacimicrobium sp. SS2-24 TaxID=2005569 RepID=UPI000B4ADBC2|nr:hypothetical protein [Lacimicrobium sp. SS2-24]